MVLIVVKNNRQRARWVGLGQVQSFMLILGRVGLDHFTCGLGWVGSSKIGPTSNSAPATSGDVLFSFVWCLLLRCLLSLQRYGAMLAANLSS